MPLGSCFTGPASFRLRPSLRARTHNLLALILLGCALGLPLRAFAQAQDGFAYNGIVYLSYQTSEYQSTPQGPLGAAALRSTGANYASVLATQYMQSYTSNVIAPETTSTPGYVSSADPLSPTDAAVVAAVTNLQAQGLTVVMKPQVDSLDGVFRGQFAPSDTAAWFASYTTFLLHYAQLASSNGVGILIIGTELKSLSGAAYLTYWSNLIAQLRSTYPNLLLVYGANATGAGDEFTTVSFWNQVDIIGVDGYFPLTNQVDPTVAQLAAAWSGNRNGFNALAALRQLQAQYNKPLIFTELGYVSAAGTNEAPYAGASSGAPYDPTEQQNCYEAFFQVFSQQSSWMKGVFWWAWTVSPPASNDEGYTPQNKPAATATLPKWFGASTPSFSLAVANPVLTLPEGQTATTVVAVTSLGGFTGSPAFTVTGLPTGVTATFTAGSAAGTQLLTLTASSSVPPGLAAISITGVSGSVSATAVVQLTVTGVASQTITFANPGAQVAGGSVPLTATASSGLPVTITSSTPSVCTVSGSAASLLAVGTCTLNANQAGNGSYAAALQVQQSFTVSPQQSFSLAASPSSSVLSQGSTTTVAITVVPAGNFTGVVTFSAGNLPSGVSAVFAPGASSSSTVLTLTASSSAALGSMTLIITGVSGSLTNVVNLPLTVQAPAGITLSSSTSAVSLRAGQSTSDSILVQSTNGFTGTVLLSAVVSSSPAGAQYLPAVTFGSTGTVSLVAGGSGAGTLTISTTAPSSAKLLQPDHPGGMFRKGQLAYAALVFALPFLFSRRKRSALWVAVIASVLLGASGCSGKSSTSSSSTTSGTTSGAYTITVTAASSATAATTVALTVQ